MTSRSQAPPPCPGRARRSGWPRVSQPGAAAPAGRSDRRPGPAAGWERNDQRAPLGHAAPNAPAQPDRPAQPDSRVEPDAPAQPDPRVQPDAPAQPDPRVEPNALAGRRFPEPHGLPRPGLPHAAHGQHGVPGHGPPPQARPPRPAGQNAVPPRDRGRPGHHGRGKDQVPRQARHRGRRRAQPGQRQAVARPDPDGCRPACLQAPARARPIRAPAPAQAPPARAPDSARARPMRGRPPAGTHVSPHPEQAPAFGREPARPGRRDGHTQSPRRARQAGRRRPSDPGQQDAVNWAHLLVLRAPAGGRGPARPRRLASRRQVPRPVERAGRTRSPRWRRRRARSPMPRFPGNRHAHHRAAPHPIRRASHCRVTTPP